MLKQWFAVGFAAALFMLAGTVAFAAPDAALDTFAKAAAAPIAVHFAPKPAGDPDGVDMHLVNFFGKAAKTLHGAFYEIREQKFVDALIAARKRKVDVKLLVDNTTYWHRTLAGEIDTHHHNPFVQQLLDAGVEVRHDKNRSALMHNKFCVVDGRFVWSGSVNLTDTYALNANNAIEMESPRMAAIYEREFDKKFTKQLFGRNAPSYAEEQKTTVQGVKMEVLFAPEDDPMSRILVLLNGAKKSVHFMQFAFTAEQVTTILMTRFKAGVAVSGIFDHRLYRSTGPYGDFATLLRAGVPVQLFSGPGLFHHKVFIIDAGTPHATVITGSQNSSANGNNNNDENVLIVHDQKIADLYEAEFNRKLKEASQVSAEAVYDKDPVAGSSLPAVNVMLTANGVADIKRIKVEYPARWPVDPESGVGISLWRAGKNVTKPCGLEFYDKGFYINRPGMTPIGSDSLLEVHIRRLKVPELPGVYNLYVSVAQGESNELKPCTQQPTIEVLPADAPSVRKALSAIAERAKAPVASVASRGDATQIADAGSEFDAVKDDVADDLASGKLDAAQRYVEYLEGLDRSDRSAVGHVTGKGREIRRALRSVSDDSPMFAPAQELLQRLEIASR